MVHNDTLVCNYHPGELNFTDLIHVIHRTMDRDRESRLHRRLLLHCLPRQLV